jgi:hypothetical protein
MSSFSVTVASEHLRKCAKCKEDIIDDRGLDLFVVHMPTLDTQPKGVPFPQTKPPIQAHILVCHSGVCSQSMRQRVQLTLDKEEMTRQEETIRKCVTYTNATDAATVSLVRDLVLESLKNGVSLDNAHVTLGAAVDCPHSVSYQLTMSPAAFANALILPSNEFVVRYSGVMWSPWLIFTCHTVIASTVSVRVVRVEDVISLSNQTVTNYVTALYARALRGATRKKNLHVFLSVHIPDGDISERDNKNNDVYNFDCDITILSAAGEEVDPLINDAMKWSDLDRPEITRHREQILKEVEDLVKLLSPMHVTEQSMDEGAWMLSVSTPRTNYRRRFGVDLNNIGGTVAVNCNSTPVGEKVPVFVSRSALSRFMLKAGVGQEARAFSRKDPKTEREGEYDDLAVAVVSASTEPIATFIGSSETALGNIHKKIPDIHFTKTKL